MSFHVIYRFGGRPAKVRKDNPQKDDASVRLPRLCRIRRIALWTVAGLCALASMTARAAVPERPNLLFIFTDDQRWDAVGYLNPFVHSPNVDRLAAEGLRFNQAVIVLPVCSPSRAAALTGRYGLANGVTTYHTPIRETEVTFAGPLRAAGYVTAMVGKWHVPGRAPTEFEFHEVRDLGNTRDHWQPRVIDNGVGRRAPGAGIDYIVDESIRIIRRARADGRPYALYLSTPHPHNKIFKGGGEERMSDATRRHYVDHPLSTMPTPPNIFDDLAGKPPYLQTYRGRVQRVGERPMTPERYQECQYATFTMVSEMDLAFGRLFAALEEMDWRRDTFIVFMSDNGLFQGEHGLMSKALHYEESIRVPLFVAGPGIAPGVDDRSLPTNLDIAPTLLDLAGLDVPANLHGASLKRTLFERAPLDRPHVFLEHPDVNATLETRAAFGLRSRRWKYIRTYEDGADRPFTFEELYDLSADPFERTNLAADPDQADLVARMRATLDEERERARR